jgi:hypothetical protein
MANTKISALTSATTPLAGTEVLPIVQSGATVKVATNDLTVRNIRANATTGILQVTGPADASTRVMTVPNANFTAARTDAAQSFTGDQTLSTGNIIQGTAAKGFNFTANAPAAGMTSQLLNWYEEGTWTPAFTASTSGTITSTDRGGRYTRVGRLVTIEGYINIASVSSPVGDLRITGLPFTIQNSAPGAGSVFQYGFANLPAVTAVQMFAQGAATYCVIRGFLNGNQVSGYAANAQASAGMQFSITYSV